MEVNLFSILSKPYLVTHFTQLICLKGIEIDSKDRTDRILNIDSVKVAGQKSPQLLLLHTGKYLTLFHFCSFGPHLQWWNLILLNYQNKLVLLVSVMFM